MVLKKENETWIYKWKFLNENTNDNQEKDLQIRKFSTWTNQLFQPTKITEENLVY